ncbi:hypothetical protein [Erythrobacter sp.]|uniref:hypothetical protein n=1 Tax=Erythrobacter sp. TaxID=1042 RepID=UPI0025EA59EA|nr:hypothetical protein [Erythrobacter sp.]
MTNTYETLVAEIVTLLGENRAVTVCTATGKIKLAHAFVHDHDPNLLTGTTANERGVLIHGSAISAVLIDENDDD